MTLTENCSLKYFAIEVKNPPKFGGMKSKKSMIEKLKHIYSLVPKDKALHFCAGFALGFFCVAFAIVAGFAKEEMDKRQEGNKFDVSDMLATWLGGVIGQLSSVWLVAHFF